MKNYKVIAIKNFTDITTGQSRIANKSEFICTEERYNFLKENNAVELIEVIEDKKEVISEEKTEKKQNKNKKNK